MKDKLFTFHKTVQGYRHICEDSPCQDNSASYNDDGLYQIICVADGHGDPTCHRSDRGSAFAVAVAQQCLKECAQAILSNDIAFEQVMQRPEYMRQLTNALLSKWHGVVRNDLLNNEITDDDLKEAGQFEEAYKKGERQEHLYGTTLIAALHVKNYLILVQQGDGRCDVFYEDGTVDQPIPWDDRCRGTMTTSMCDRDAFDRIRSQVIDLEERNVIACFIGSDGVEDSYYDNEQTQLGTHRFYMELICKVHQNGTEAFDTYLDEMLPVFTKEGSQDDVSVAGIIDLEKTAKLLSNYQSNVERYECSIKLKIDLEAAKLKLISMTRKHGILADHISEIEQDIVSAKNEYQLTVQKIQKLKKAYEKQVASTEQAKKTMEEYQQDSLRITDELKGRYSRFAIAVQHFIADIANGVSLKETVYRESMEQLLEYDRLIKEEEDTEKKLCDRIAKLEQNLIEARSTFDEYDQRFCILKDTIENDQKEILNLESNGR